MRSANARRAALRRKARQSRHWRPLVVSPDETADERDRREQLERLRQTT